MSKLTFVLAVATLSACGGGGGDDDDDVQIDAPPSTLQEVNPCPGTTDATVLTTGAFAFMPKDTTITQGQVIKFDMDPSHDVAPTGNTDATLRVPLGGTKCFRFTAPGAFSFKCTPHGFTGSVTVN
ncbi:MAG: hypothetical protein ABI867_21910 [Kofleriaceae bacterium]